MCLKFHTNIFIDDEKKLEKKKDAMTPKIPIYYIASRELNYEVGKKFHNWVLQMFALINSFSSTHILFLCFQIVNN